MKLYRPLDTTYTYADDDCEISFPRISMALSKLHFVTAKVASLIFLDRFSWALWPVRVVSSLSVFTRCNVRG